MQSLMATTGGGRSFVTATRDRVDDGEWTIKSCPPSSSTVDIQHKPSADHQALPLNSSQIRSQSDVHLRSSSSLGNQTKDDGGLIRNPKERFLIILERIRQKSNYGGLISFQSLTNCRVTLVGE